MVHFTGLLENARHPPAGPCCWTLVGDLCKNRLPAGIRGWAGTATGGQIHVVHISHTHPPKELIQTLRKYLLGKNTLFVTNTSMIFHGCSQVVHHLHPITLTFCLKFIKIRSAQQFRWLDIISSEFRAGACIFPNLPQGRYAC